MADKHITRPALGLHTDNSPQDQPENTYRYALNTVPETTEGDIRFRSVEGANEVCGQLPLGYIPIGKVYMGNGEMAILSVNETEGLSEIGIHYDNCDYETIVNAELGFMLQNQIDVTFRLRRGCERVIYYAARDLFPGRFNFDKLDDFKDDMDNWVPEKFKLFKVQNSNTQIDNIEITTNGSLAPGSYNIALQYLDEDLNPTEWILTSDTIIIYNDDPNSKGFAEIRGSTNAKTAYQDFGITNKAIKVSLENLNDNFAFYRIAIIEATSGSGQITKVSFSSEIPVSVKTYTYTGTNAFSQGTEEEIQEFKFIIESAEHIDQVENALILANIKGKDINYCRLQKYASKIQADLALESIVLNNTEVVNNQKRGTVHLEKIGYMPGEIYSFGIIYILADGSFTPVYHIPGSHSSYNTLMSKDNILEDSFYTTLNDCDILDYWGVDGQGNPLTDELIRHHRFPLRSEINEPLLTKDSDSTTILSNVLFIDITGEIGELVTLDTIEYTIYYTIDGSPFSETNFIDVESYDPDAGLFNIQIASSIDAVVYVEVKELDETMTLVDPSLYSTLTYTARVEQVTTNIDNSVYTSRIMGITFSNIDMPSLEDTNGNEVVGYYIVRQERTEDNKTILDNGILTPLLVEERAGVERFVAHGHLLPNATNLKEDVVALIHPEHKFNNREYPNTTTFIKEGEFVKQSSNLGVGDIQDVMPGTSYDSSVNTRRERDTDGFDLALLVRSNQVDYVRREEVLAEEAEIESIFYLDALFSKTITDVNSDQKDIYNLSSDNKIGIVQLNISLDTEDLETKLPYVVMKRELAAPYATFRVDPYYKETVNYHTFSGDTGNTTTIYNGDSYISPMRYASTMFYDIRLKSRRTKKAVLNFVLGVLAIVAGTVLALTGVGAGIGVPLLVIGFGVTQLATGIRKAQMSKVYQDLYEQGLKDTVDDADTNAEFGPNPPDDQIQWFLDSLNEIWIESGVNMNWRMGNTIGLTDFLDTPVSYDEAELVSYGYDKITTVDSEADGGRTYQGYAKAEIYELNKDYQRRDRQKIFYHLAFEYNCCSECQETFPHRVLKSETAFQEELTDNFRTFLPNNYIDLEGQTGKISDIFVIQNNLFIHTEECLYHLPQNIQERVTGDIVSFLGTGEYFSILPRKIVDDDSGNSAGTRHKWATIKTPYGVFFVSEHQRAIYHFDGNKLKPISAEGEYNWFKNNIPVLFDQNHYNATRQRYPYLNNPSNPYGTGFISTYDSRKERLIFTKKDFTIDPDQLPADDYVLCYSGGELILFEDFSNIITVQAEEGWVFKGIEDCELVFEREITEIIEVEVISEIPNTTDVHVFIDTSGSFGDPEDVCITSITDAIDDWLINFAIENPDWAGTLYTYENSTERWLAFPGLLASTTYLGEDLSTKDIIFISFVNEAQPNYHGTTLTFPIASPTATFLTDRTDFIAVHAQYNSFRGILYPIVFGPDAGNCGSGGGDLETSREFLLHSIAAVFGTEMTGVEVGTELSSPNPGFTTAEWNDLKDALQTANPYPDDGLKNYDWIGKWDRAADEDGNVIDSNQFNLDITELLTAFIETEIVEVEVPALEVQTIPGTPIEEPIIIDHSWTKSFYLKDFSWIGYHSYLPNFYMHSPEKFYSWINGSLSFWRHNKLNQYQTYYGTFCSFIIECVATSMQTKIYEGIMLHTEAKRYDAATEEYLDERNITFNKLIAYNSAQCTGEIDLVVKDTQNFPALYLNQQLTNSLQTILIDRNERNWTLNELRDMVIDETVPMFIRKKEDLQTDYYTDKILNSDSIDYNKSWTQMEPMRDKYLIVRLIFNNFDSVKLILNYSIKDEVISQR